MTKKQKRKKLNKNFAVIITIAFVLSAIASAPAMAATPTGNSQVVVTQSSKHKKDIQDVRKTYKDEIKTSNSDYRTAVQAAKSEYNQELNNAKTKSDRMEARKNFRKSIRDARAKMLKDKRAQQQEFKLNVSALN
jgi:dsDNA-specific endonuclease/ATPase MutS2